MRALNVELQDLSRRQSGLLTASQLSTAGFRRRDIELRISRGEWQRRTETVVAVHAQNDTRTGELWAAALHFKRCGLAGPSVLELHGMPTPHDRRVHVIGPRAGWYSPVPSVVTHASKNCELVNDDPLRVGLDVAVLQAVRWAVTARQAVFYATWAIQHGLVTHEALKQLERGTPMSPGTARMHRRLAIIEPGIHSVNEFDFAQQCRSHGLPEPDRQRQRVDSTGRTRYMDAEFTVNGRRLVVEIDGLHHLDSQVNLEDQWRANEVVIQGTPVIRIPGVALRLDPEPFFDQLRRALANLRRAA